MDSYVNANTLMTRLESVGVRDLEMIRAIVTALEEKTPIFGRECSVETIQASFEVQRLGIPPRDGIICRKEREELYAYGRIAGMIGEQVMKHVRIGRYKGMHGDVLRASVRVIDE